jgi:hypothetical protein
MIRDDLKRHKANQKITNTIVKNTNEKGEWKTIRRLEPKDCKVGDVVLLNVPSVNSTHSLLSQS